MRPWNKTKLQIPGRHRGFEQEAERVAAQFIRMPNGMLDATVREQTDSPIQRGVSGGNNSISNVPPLLRDVLSSVGAPLETSTRRFFESRFGWDFSRVRVYSDEKSAESADAIKAQAYTVGSKIVFGSGKYTPSQADGKRLLAHELTHVVQQTHLRQKDVIQKSSESDVTAGEQDESISLDFEISSRYELIIDGQPYEILLTSNPESWGDSYHGFRSDIQEYLGKYPNLGRGNWAFIVQQAGAGFCQIKGNCLGWTKGSFRVIDPPQRVWEKVPEYIQSTGIRVPKRRTALDVYNRSIQSNDVPPAAIWDYYMLTEFNAVPELNEANANLALYGRNFINTSGGPSHIAFRPKGGKFWLSKPSYVVPPILHERGDQISGGDIGDIVRYYKREGGELGHIYLRPHSRSD